MYQIKTADFQKIIKAAIENVIKEREELNRINVFPIPDRDTGENLFSTLQPLYRLIDTSDLVGVDQLAIRFSEWMLDSAKGFSGVIFSHYFRDFARTLKGKSFIQAGDLALAMENGARAASLALENPKEGTILTLMRQAAEQFKKIAENEENISNIFSQLIPSIGIALEKTKEQLPELKKARVVDAGGLGFYLFFQGIASALKDEPGDTASTSEGETARTDGSGDFQKEFESLQTIRQQSKKVKTAVLVDSAVDLPAEIKKKYQVLVIPLQISMEGRFFREDYELSKERFYQRLLQNKNLFLKTSQPSPQDLIRFYRMAREYSPEVLVFTLSSLLSGTYQGALSAASSVWKENEKNHYILDSRNVSAGSGLLVWRALEMLEKGKSLKETILEIEKIRSKVVSLGYLETLDYVVKGGRIPASIGFIAKILRLKPMIAFEEGRLVKKGILISGLRKEKRIVSRFLKRLDQQKVYSVGIVYTDNPQTAEIVQKELQKSSLKIKNIFQVIAAAVLGAHAGPGTFCLFALPEP